MGRLDRCYNIADLREVALRRLPKGVFEYLDKGTEDMVALRFAALAGVGVAQFPSIVVKEDLRAGALVDLLPAWAPRAGIIHAVFPSRRGLLPSVRALLDFLAAEYAAPTQA